MRAQELIHPSIQPPMARDNSNRQYPDNFWRHSKFLFLISLFVFSSSQVQSEIALSDKSINDGKTFSDDYVDPFLITQAKKTFSQTPKEMGLRIRRKLTEGKLNIKGLFSSGGESWESLKEETYSLPKEVVQEAQLEAIQNCQSEKCLMKLSNSEIVQLSKSKTKKDTYRGQVFQRILQYLKKRELRGYEDRASNVKQVKQMVDLFPSLSQSSLTRKYLKTDFWNKLDSLGKPLDSWLRQEMVNIAPDQMQPILRVSEDFEFLEGARVLFFELPIYTNHYFDSSVSLYEIVSKKNNPNEAEVIISDVMEIDELKKTALIRAMFKGKMVKAVNQYQSDFLDSLLSENEK